MSESQTPLSGQTRCECGRICSDTWAFCPLCGTHLNEEICDHPDCEEPISEEALDDDVDHYWCSDECFLEYAAGQGGQ